MNCYIHTYPLGESRWESLYRQGAAWSPPRSATYPTSAGPRISNFAAARITTEPSGRRHHASSRLPILLDLRHRHDSAIGSLAAYSRASGLIVRDRASRFASISVEFLIELAEQLGVPVHYQNLTPDELVECDEAAGVDAWCMLPVATLDDRPLTGGHHFAMFHRLLTAWSQQVGARID